MAKRGAAWAVVGWREWGALPEFDIPLLKIKVDTGARTSCIHATRIEPFHHRGDEWIRFVVHPDEPHRAVPCEHLVLDRRKVSDSGGHREHRYVIGTDLVVGTHRFRVDFTLTDRSDMRFRMLLGRTAIAHTFLVDVAHSYLQGKPGKGPKRD